MNDELPTFDEKKVYTLSGKTLNKIMAAIRARTLIRIEGFGAKRTPEGVEFTKNP